MTEWRRKHHASEARVVKATGVELEIARFSNLLMARDF